MQWHSITRAEAVISLLDQILPARYLIILLNVKCEYNCSRNRSPKPVTTVTADLMQATITGLEGSSGRPPDERDCFVIGLHALASGLLRVKLQGPAGGRTSLATPLVDGMVVSRRALGSMVRQTALNMCRRRRLDNDRYN